MRHALHLQGEHLERAAAYVHRVFARFRPCSYGETEGALRFSPR